MAQIYVPQHEYKTNFHHYNDQMQEQLAFQVQDHQPEQRVESRVEEQYTSNFAQKYFKGSFESQD